MTPEKLIRVVYISTAVQEFTHDELLELTKQSAERNREDGITGILCYKGGSFLQVIEGPEQAMRGLWDRLNRDERHTWLQLLRDEAIEERLFESWNMGLCDLETEDCEARAEFRAIAGFLANCKGLDANAVVLGLVRHFGLMSRTRPGVDAA